MRLLLLLPLLLSSVAAAQNLTIGALGDSITVGFDARDFGENRELSWSTGDNVNSHKKRLETMYTQVNAVNEAVAGAVASDLKDQLDLLLPQDPAYVTVMIGGNDVCSSGFNEENFRTNLTDALQRLTNSSTRNILVVPVPDMLHMRELGLRSPQCQFIWDIAGTCPMLLSSQSTVANRQAFKERISAVNSVLEDVSRQYGAKYAEGIATEQFLPQHISQIDCFHPSEAGQDFLSLKTWNVAMWH